MTLENIDKKQVVADLVTHLRGGVREDDQEVAMRREDAAPICEDEHDVDDVSHQDEAGDLHELFQEVDDKQKALIEAAQKLDVSPKSSVDAGAVIVMDGERYIVGIASDTFTSGGAQYSGMSSDAPAFDVLKGATAGESHEVNGHTMTVDEIA